VVLATARGAAAVTGGAGDGAEGSGCDGRSNFYYLCRDLQTDTKNSKKQNEKA